MRIQAVVGLVVMAGAMGCGAPEDATALDEAAAAQPLVACTQGMTVELQPVDPARARCDLDQLPAMVDHVCGTDAVVCDFLRSTVADSATIQCSPSSDEAGFCADVIDRVVEGRTHNFFAAYLDEAPEMQAHWDAALTNPDFQRAPISLSELAPVQAASGKALQRLVTFDPRECTNCGVYSGPNVDLVSDPYLLQKDIWPEFYADTCKFEYARNKLTTLGAQRCAAEVRFRAPLG